MHDILQQILAFFGKGLCHQYPERSFEAGGLYFSVCARDTGIYVGLIFTLLIIVLMYVRKREKPAAMPQAWIVVVCIVLVLPMAIDGVASYAGLYETNNLLRFFTGYLCGMGIAVLASGGLFNLWQHATHERSAIDSPRRLWTVLVASSACAAAFYLLYPHLGIITPLLAFLCQLLAFTFISVLIISTTPLWKRGQSSKRYLALVALSVVLAFAILALFSLIASALSLAFPWVKHL